MKKILIALLVSYAFSFTAFAAVNINTATQQELESLDGVGEVKAKAIIDYRKKNGGFKSVDELEKVDGVGEVTLKNIRKDVSTSGKTTVATPAKKDSLVKAAESKTGDAKTKKAKANTKAKSDLIKDGKPAKETSLVKSAESKTGDAKTTKAKKVAKPSKADAAKDAKAAKDTSLIKAAEAKTKEEKTTKVKKPAKTKKADVEKAE